MASEIFDGRVAAGQTTSATALKTPAAGSVGPSRAAVQSPVKGRRFQRSRHAEQQSRSRSQDAVTTSIQKDGFLESGVRPLQKSKSVDVDLEKVAPPPVAAGKGRRSNTVEAVEVQKLGAALGGAAQKVEKKASFLSRSSSLLARLSGKTGHKKLQSPSPLRRDDNPSNSASVDTGDDSFSVNSIHSKTTSPSPAGHLETASSANGGTPQQRSSSSAFQPALVRSRSDNTQSTSWTNSAAVESEGICRCRAPLSRPALYGVRCREKELEQGSEIVLAAETRWGLRGPASAEVPVSQCHAGNCSCRPPAGENDPEPGETLQTGVATKLGFYGAGRRVSVSAGDLVSRITTSKTTEDDASAQVQPCGMTSTAPCEEALLDDAGKASLSTRKYGKYR